MSGVRMYSFLILVVALVAPVAASQKVSSDADSSLALPLAASVEMIFIKGGTFTMGNPLPKRSPEFHPDEPLIRVTVQDFRIAKTPVTASQFCEFLNSPEGKAADVAGFYANRWGRWNHYSTIRNDGNLFVPARGAEDVPVDVVTWLAAVTFCEWLSTETGRSFRLPTEAEWEFAARGAQGRLWPWGDEDADAEHGWRNGMRVSSRSGKREQLAKVGRYPANATPDGVADMLGHCKGEWCTNKFVEKPSATQVLDSAVDVDDLTTPRVVRGYMHRLENRKRRNFLSWLFLPEVGHHDGRVWTRVGIHPTEGPEQALRHGFRVVEEISRSLPNGSDAEQTE